MIPNLALCSTVSRGDSLRVISADLYLVALDNGRTRTGRGNMGFNTQKGGPAYRLTWHPGNYLVMLQTHA